MEDLSKTRLMPVIRGAASDAAANPGNSEWPLSSSQEVPSRHQMTAACLLRLLQADYSATMQPNPVMAAAAPLLLVLAAVHENPTLQPSTDFEHALIRALHRFDEQAISRGVNSDCVNAARYVLCTALDEAILATDWARGSDWARHSLLQRFHNETHGGDKFFSLLETLLMRHTLFFDLLQLCHFCLAIGFAGRLHLDPHGRYKIDALCNQIYQALQKKNACLVQNPILRESRKPVPNRITHRTKRHNHAVIALIIYSCIFAGMRFWLDISTEKASVRLDTPESHFNHGISEYTP